MKTIMLIMNYNQAQNEYERNTDEMVDWIKPIYSKKKIRKAGEVLKGKSYDSMTYELADNILSNWRGAHTFPLNIAQNCIRHLAKSVSDDFVVTQRLKRKASITAKLDRFPEMSLERMQDIGGCRIILPNIEEVIELSTKIKNNSTLNIQKEYDYITNPKNSGYRSIHLMSKYDGRQEDYKNLQIEIQIRSKIQHCWATAVEIVDTFTNEKLKIGQGSAKWNLFFQNISKLFNNIEYNIPIEDSIIQTIKELDEEIRATYNLLTYSLFTNITEDLKNKKGLFLLILNIKKKQINVKHFKKNELEKALKEYKIEENIVDNNVVLVNTQSINELRKGYPNYFADWELFIKLLREHIPPN